MRGRRLVSLVLAAAGPVVVVAVVIPWRDRIENTNVALGLVVVVLLAAVVGGRSAAIVASVSAAVSFDFFLTRPFNSLRITASDDVQTTALLVVIGVIAGELVERARRNGATAAARQSELNAVYDRAQLSAGAESSGALIELASQELTRLLDLDSCRYVSGSSPLLMPELRHNSIRVPANADPSSRGLVSLPVRAHGRLQGQFVMSFASDSVGLAVTPDQRHAAVALADQVGVGLLRFRDG